MNMRKAEIQFEFGGGAGGEVTGSALGLSLPTDGKGKPTNLLLDYGAFMGGEPDETYIDNKRLISSVFKLFKDEKDINDVILSHSHVDHEGRLTNLIRYGFYGRIFCTDPTRQISGLMLKDAKKIEELTLDQNYESILKLAREETRETFIDRGKGDKHRVKQESKRHDDKMARLIQPKTYAEIEKTLQHMCVVPVGGDFREIRENVSFRLLNAGHILGSTMTELRLSFGDKFLGILDTNDIGNPDKESYLGQPDFDGIRSKIDLAFIESTYGNKERPERQPQLDKMLRNIISTLQNGGKVLIPAFALERTQEILTFISENLAKINGQVGYNVPVFLDSRLAQDVTDLYRKILRSKNEKIPFEEILRYQNFHKVSSENRLASVYGEGNQSAGIIVASSGMCDAGPVREHLAQLIENENSLIQFIGYPGSDTLADRIQRSSKFKHGYVKIGRVYFSVKAKVENCGQFSSHPDAKALVNMVDNIPFRDIHTSKLVIKHGSKAAANGLKERILDTIDFNPNNILIPENPKNGSVIYHVPISIINT
jgi:metallo-beta-lactamase family protein